MQKRLPHDVEFSAQYDSIDDVQFLGQAFSFGNVPGKIVNDIRIEAMERVTGHARYGWAAIAGRNLTARGSLRGQIIVSDIPQNLYIRDGVTLLHNQGEIDRGRRLSGKLTCRVGRSWEAGIWAGRRLDATPGKRWVVQVFISHDFAGLLNHLMNERSS